MDDAKQRTVLCERDFALPPRLAALSWVRRYGGATLGGPGPAPHGPGWWTLAQARVRVLNREALILDGPEGPRRVPVEAGPPTSGMPAVQTRARGGGWTLCWGERSPVGAQQWVFDRSGLLVAVQGADLGVTALHHRDGRLVRLDHDGGRSLRLRWMDDRVVAARLTDGREVAYLYNRSGELIGVEGAAAGRRFAVDGSGRLTAAFDADGVPVTGSGAGALEGDLAGVGDGGVDADGVRTEVVRDADGCVIAVTDGAGTTTTYEPHPSGAPAVIRYADGAEARLERDGAGRLLALVDTAGAVTRFERSPAGRVTAVVDPLGNRTVIGHGPDGRVARVADARGHAVTLRYDEHGHLAALAGEAGSVWTFADPLGGRPSIVTGPDASTWTVHRADDGAVTELVDPLGGVTRYRREPGGRCETVTDPSGGDCRVTRDAAGRPVERVDATGAVTRLDWDDRSVTRVDADGATRRWSWSAAGRLASTEAGDDGPTAVIRDGTGRVAGIVGAGGGGWVLVRDRRDRVVSAAAPTGRTVRVEHDPAGRVAAVEVGTSRWSCARDAAGNVIAVTFPAGGTWTLDRDAAGRVQAIVDPVGAVTRLRRDARGAVVGREDADGAAASVRRDGQGRTVERRDPLGGITRYRRDRLGRLVELLRPGGERVALTRDPRGAVLAVDVDGRPVLRCERDAAGRLTELVEVDGGRTQVLRWTPAGRLASWTCGGDHLGWEYDRAGRVLVRRGMGDHRRHEYDRDGRLIGVISERLGSVRLSRDADGRLTGLDAAGLRRWWRHDDRGWLVEYTEQLGNEVPRSTRLGRDAAGRIVDVTGPHGEQALLGYDEAGRLIARVDPAGVVRYEYSAAGDLIAERRPGGPDRRYLTDAAHRLVRIEHGDDAGGAVAVTHDALGRRLAEEGAAGRRRFRYGPLGHVAGIEHDGADVAIAVDPLGRLVAVGDQTLAWDPVGSPAHPTRMGRHHLHRIAGQLVAVTGDGDGAVRWISTDWQGAVTDGSGAAGLCLADGVEVDGLRWTGDRFHDPATRRDVAPPGLRLVLAAGAGAVAAPARRPGGDAVGRGLRRGHWDAAAIVRQVVVAGVGEPAGAVLADAYDLTGLPGADASVDAREVVCRALGGPVPAGGGFGNSAFPAFRPRP